MVGSTKRGGFRSEDLEEDRGSTKRWVREEMPKVTRCAPVYNLSRLKIETSRKTQEEDTGGLELSQRDVGKIMKMF